MSTKLEIEKKFIVKGLPNKPLYDVVKIEQFYWKNSAGIWERARIWDSSKDGKKWIHTIKTPAGKGANIEEEHDLTELEFTAFVERSKRDEGKHLSKVRNIYIDENRMKWEVDVFNEVHLIIAEVELPKKNFSLKIPRFMKQIILLEVTNLKQFGNRSLANKLN